MLEHSRITVCTTVLVALLNLAAPLAVASPPSLMTVLGPEGGAMRIAQFQVLDEGDSPDMVSGTESPDGAIDNAASNASELEADEEGNSTVPAAEAQVFTWRAHKSEQAIVLEGFVSSAALQSFIAVRAGAGVVDETIIRDGAPEGFALNVLAGLKALTTLENGTLSYDVEGWILEGNLASGGSRDEIVTALDAAETPVGAWTLEIDAVRPQSVANREGASREPHQEVPQPSPDSDVASEQNGAGSEVDQQEIDTAAVDTTSQNSGAETAPSTQAEASERADERAPEMSEAADSAESATGLTDAEPVPEYRFSALRSTDGTLAMQGDVPDPATRALLTGLAGSAERDALTINPDAPQDFVSMLYAGLAALDHLDQGQLAFANGMWLLSGHAHIDTQKAEALEVLARLGGEGRFRIMITAPPAVTVCKAELEAFMDGKSILFASGSANLTPQSKALLPEIARALDICPQTTVYVEGHTDSDGGAALNLPLSVARAETVVDELIALGVSVERLYAVGYGSSLPIASNDTTDGKRRNRRIVFTFEDIAQ